jgi:zinc protease
MEERLVSLGTKERAYTSFDETVYPNRVPAHLLPALLEVEGRRLVDPLAGVDEGTFAVERDIVRNELREGHETDAAGESFDAAYREAFPPSHPYSRPIIGTHESLDSLTLVDARRFISSYYRPEDMTMVIVADLDLAGAEAFVRAHLPPALYGDPAHARPFRGHGVPPLEPPPLAAVGPLGRASASVTSPELWIAWTTPGGFGADRSASDLWAGLAWGNFQQARLDDTDVASVDFFSIPHALASLFLCRVRLARGDHPEQSLREVLATLPWTGGDDMWRAQRFDELKLDRLRDLAFEAESSSNRALERALFAHFDGGANAYGALVDSAKSITDDLAVDFAHRYFDPARARAVLVEPLRPDERSPKSGAIARAAAPRWNYEPPPPLTIGDLADMRYLAALKTRTLANGLEVMTLPRPGAPVVTVTLAFHGGSAEAAPGVAEAASEALELHWEERPGDYGVWWSFRPERDLVRVTMRAGAGNLPRVLDMLSFVVRGYEIEWPSEKFKTTRLPWLQREESSAHNRNERAFRDALFAGNRLGAIATAEQTSAVSKTAITEWLDRVVTPANGALVIVGDIDGAEAQEAALGAFSGWKASAGALPALAPVLPRGDVSSRSALAAEKAIVASRPGATQAEVRLGCLLPPADAHAAAVYEVAGHKIRSTILTPIRERLGSTYEFDVETTIWRDGSTMMSFRSLIDNRRLGIVLGVLRMFWSWAATARLTAPSDVEHIRRIGLDDARDHLLTLDRSAALADSLVTAWNRRWPASSIDDETGALTHVDTSEIEATLHTCAHNLVFAVTGDDAVVRQALAQKPPMQRQVLNRAAIGHATEAPATTLPVPGAPPPSANATSR